MSRLWYESSGQVSPFMGIIKDMETDLPPTAPIFEEGDLVQTQDGDIGIILAPYPIYEMGWVDYYVKINDEIEIHRATTLKRAEL